MLSLDCKTYCVAPLFLGRKGNNDLILGKKKKHYFGGIFGLFPKNGNFSKKRGFIFDP